MHFVPSSIESPGLYGVAGIVMVERIIDEFIGR